jgi:hypothetical protein
LGSADLANWAVNAPELFTSNYPQCQPVNFSVSQTKLNDIEVDVTSLQGADFTDDILSISTKMPPGKTEFILESCNWLVCSNYIE